MYKVQTVTVGLPFILKHVYTTQLSGVIFLKSCDVCAASETFDLP